MIISVPLQTPAMIEGCLYSMGGGNVLPFYNFLRPVVGAVLVMERKSNKVSGSFSTAK